MTVWLTGCVVIEGGRVVWTPVPLKVAVFLEPLERVKVKVPVYACAAVGLKLTVPVKL